MHTKQSLHERLYRILLEDFNNGIISEYLLRSIIFDMACVNPEKYGW